MEGNGNQPVERTRFERSALRKPTRSLNDCFGSEADPLQRCAGSTVEHIISRHIRARHAAGLGVSR